MYLTITTPGEWLQRLKLALWPPHASEVDIVMRHRKEAEENANLLRQRIDRVTSLREAYDVFDLVIEYMQTWDNNAQVRGWAYTLMNELRKKQELIMSKH